MTKRTVVIFYYATYCKDCAGEEYVLEQLAEKFPKLVIQRTNILAINIKEHPDIRKVPTFEIHRADGGTIVLSGFQSYTELEAILRQKGAYDDGKE